MLEARALPDSGRYPGAACVSRTLLTCTAAAQLSRLLGRSGPRAGLAAGQVVAVALCVGERGG